MTKSKNPTPPPNSEPTYARAATLTGRDLASLQDQPYEKTYAGKLDAANARVEAGEITTPEQFVGALDNSQVINALSGAPPYLLSRAETMMVAYRHTLGHDNAPFANLSPIERAAWLAVASSVET